LLTARAADLPQAPARGWIGKRIRFRFDAERRVKLLTWTSSGQTYTLGSNLPGFGARSCLLCHTDATRRKLIDELGTGTGGANRRHGS
jgi:hypothetical protein